MAASPVVQFRAKDILGDQLSARVERGNYTQIAQRDLERYYYILRTSLPTFSMEDAFVLVNALNGHLATPETAHLLWAEVEDFLIHSGVDSAPMALVERLRKLSRFECMAIIDAVERAWNSETYRIADMDERLRQVGLVK